MFAPQRVPTFKEKGRKRIESELRDGRTFLDTYFAVARLKHDRRKEAINIVERPTTETLQQWAMQVAFELTSEKFLFTVS